MLKNLLIVIFCTLLLTGCGGGGSDGGGDETGEILGNPPDVALQVEEYLPGDQLYKEGHPDYYKEGTPYVTAKIEQSIKELLHHPAIPIMEEKLNGEVPEAYMTADGPGGHFFPKKYLNENAINEIILIDSDTGRKEIIGSFFFWIDSYLIKIYGISRFPEEFIIPEEERDINKLNEEEKNIVMDFSTKYENLEGQYLNINLARASKLSVSGAKVLK